MHHVGGWWWTLTRTVRAAESQTVLATPLPSAIIHSHAIPFDFKPSNGHLPRTKKQVWDPCSTCYLLLCRWVVRVSGKNEFYLVVVIHYVRFQAENVLFRVHRDLLRVKSPAFDGMFSLPTSFKGANVQGQTDENVIFLEQVTTRELEHFFVYLYTK